MNGRYSPTERIGVNAVERIVIEELGWIFREQPIVDVGVDAIIEQCENGNPTGKLIAIQIKTQTKDSKSIFEVSKSKLIYRATNIHYNYWVNYDIPVIMIAYIIETKEAYWQHIRKENFKKIGKKWRIEIPRSNEFCNKSKGKIARILSERGKRHFMFDIYRGNIPEENEFTLKIKTECITESSICFRNIVNTMQDFNKKIDRATENLKEYRSIDDDRKFCRKIAFMNGLSRDMNISSERFELEIRLFSKLYSEGFYGCEQMILLEPIVCKTIIDQELADKIKNLPYSIDSTNRLLSSLREAIDMLGDCFFVYEEYKYSSKESKNRLIDVIDLIISELCDAKDIALKLYEKIKNKAIVHSDDHQPPSLP